MLKEEESLHLAQLVLPTVYNSPIYPGLAAFIWEMKNE